MEYISAPWREEYVRQIFKMNECIFCRAIKLKNERDALILFKGTHNFIVLNKYPYTAGHLMIAPYKHLATFEGTKKESSDEMTDLLKLSLKALKKEFRPNGFNTGMNIGKSAGAGVADHYHFHVIPRWTGDSNFMAIVGKTKVMMNDLETTYDRLFPLFQKLKMEP